MSSVDLAQFDVVVDGGKLRVDMVGSTGELVVCWPGGGRPGTDLLPLASRIAASGWRVALIHPRGCVGSAANVQGCSLHDLAADAAAVIERCGGGPAFVAGHAFGNRVMRCLATDRPELVSGVVLLAAGGARPPENLDDLALLGSKDASREVRVAAMRRAFFESDSDPTAWLTSGGPGASELYRTCVQPPLSKWWHGGRAPMLVVQGGRDRSAVPANGRQLADTFPDRVDLVTIPEAAHAFPLERPEETAEHVVSWLRRTGREQVHPLRSRCHPPS